MVPYVITAAVMYSNKPVAWALSWCHQSWLIHDDNQPPTSQTDLPAWFNQGISHVWLLRPDRLRYWNDASLTAAAGSDEAQMTMAEVRAFFQQWMLI